MEDTSVVRVDVNPAVSDFYDLRKGSNVRYLDWVLVLIGLLYAYFVLPEIFNDGVGKTNATIVATYSGVSLLAFFGILFVRRMWAHLMFRHGPTLQQPRKYSVSGSGLEVDSEAMTCSFRRNAFSRILETRRSFLFFLSPIFGIVVPKRCVSSLDDIVRLRDLVTQQFKGQLKLRR